MAHDLTQDAIEKAERVYRANQVQFPRALLFKVGLNLARMHIRHESMVARTLGTRAPVDEVEAQGALAHDGVPDREVARAQLRRYLVEAINQLPPKPRDVFVMGHMEERPRAEIARRMHTSEKRIDKLMGRAHKRLRELLGRQGLGPRDLSE